MIAFISLSEDGRVAADSAVEIRAGGVVLADGPVPERVEHGGRMGSARVLTALAALGYRAPRYFEEQRRVPGGIEVDVEPLS